MDTVSADLPPPAQQEPEDPYVLMGQIAAALRWQVSAGAAFIDRKLSADYPLPPLQPEKTAQPTSPEKQNSPFPGGAPSPGGTKGPSPQPPVVTGPLTVSDSNRIRIMPPVQRQTTIRPANDKAAPPQLIPTMANLRQTIGDCQRCERGTAPTQLVFGQGNPRARLLVVLGQPSFQDSEQGQALTGATGQLFTKMLAAMGLGRDDIWLTHLVMCPGDEEQPVPRPVLTACAGLLRKQFDIVRPEVVILFSEFVAQPLLRQTAPLAQLRGQWHELLGVPAMPTWGLRDLLAVESRKRETWTDLTAVMGRLGLKDPRKPQ